MKRQKIARAEPRVRRAPDRPGASGTVAPAHPVLALQRRVGNQAAARIVQAKLRVSPPGDVHEQEADRVADDVMRMPAGGSAGVQRRAIRAVQARCADCGRAESETARTLQRAPAVSTEDRRDEELEEGEGVQPLLQASAPRAVPAVSAQAEARIGDARGAGDTLPPGPRDFFESRFGSDFSGVRVHTDSRAAGTSRELGARAFTVGPDIFFGEGQYRPESTAGRRLLAHELTHVVQQSGAVPLGRRSSGRAGSAAGAPSLQFAPTPAARAIAFNNRRNFDARTISILQVAAGAAATGVWDHATIQQIMAFQRTNGLHADGMVGPGTLRRLIETLVAAAQFDDTIHVIVDAFNFPTANLGSIRFDATVTGADAETSGTIGTGKPQTVRVGPSTFVAGYAHMIRIIGHELQHVQQRSGATPITNQHLREFLAFAWEALSVDSPPLMATERVNHAQIAIQHWNQVPATVRAPHQVVRDRLDQLITAGGVGNF